MAKSAANSTALNSDHISKRGQTPIGWRNSPSHYGRISRALHWLTVAALLLWLPAFAILRQYGRGGALRFYGMELLPEAERNITWMIAPADLLHGPLSWPLCGLVIGHIAMALIHRFWLKDRVLARMVGSSGR